MNVLLITRSEIICLVILIFLLVYSIIYSQRKEKDRFIRICIFALGHVVLDGITVYTVNHLDIVPLWLNWICHMVFYVFALLFCYEFFCYVAYVALPEKLAKPVSYVVLAAPVLFVIVSPLLRIDYLTGRGTNYSFGPCVYVGYGTAAVILLAGFLVLVFNYRKLEKNARFCLLPMVIFMLASIIVQAVLPELLFTGAGMTLVTVGMYFAIENPAEKYRMRAMFDPDTSARSKTSYEEDMKYLNEHYRSGFHRKMVACVMADINNLKLINDRYGHLEGDEMIRMTAKILLGNLKNAFNVYRIGGDEFLAVYVDKGEVLISEEVQAVRRECGEARTEEGHALGLSVGYAVSTGCETMEEILEEADRKMYAEKARMKQNG